MQIVEPIKYLRTPDAARRLSLSTSLLEKMRVSGDGPAYFKVGAAVLYDPKDIDDWVLRRKRSSTSSPD
jgi:predicted DNA-binding transcriptional regulator AlpA